MKRATHQDWKTQPLPDKTETAFINRTYSQEEFSAIAMGKIPEQMEDKWFAYYEAPNMYIHRSWTGYCIFKVTFEFVDDMTAISELKINRDTEQGGKIGDPNLAGILLDCWANRDVKQQMLDYIKNNKSDKETT